ncbi:hypothetical protein KSP39_PZI008798 [Platanthera zijinensis]|uniref:Uncharacterized protein n=1 Tax=Platanthera zijinensis TaxID=2320716 RepID=A0AAP0G7L4_9ASPA
MTPADQSLITEALEELEDEEKDEIVALGRCADPEGEENSRSPSHLPFAPSSVLPDTTTVDPSYIISLIRKLLPDNTSTLKSSEYVACSSSAETSKICSVEENISGKFNHVKKIADIEDNSNAGPHDIVYDRYVGSIEHHFYDQTYSSSAISNGMTPNSRKEETGSYDHETRFLHKENAWEDSGCILWDLSASSTHAEFMVSNYLLEVLISSLHASKSPRITTSQMLE